ncbi:MAG: hypothetical protein JKY49_05030 [Cohaesibacteraceae bacterium]|nr:hypothetical protein [Cohaesibacteraceae bacterium]MBL4876076.1 hypothetical protein [Cohaesibacteraceae bacterium]
MKRTFAGLVTLVLTTVHAGAIECTQENAIYSNGSVFELSLSDPKRERIPYYLSLSNLKSGQTFGGEIEINRDRGYPTATLGFDCKIDEQFRHLCDIDIFSHYIYVLKNLDASLGLPKSSDPAAEAILLVDLNMSFGSYFGSDLMQQTPGDVFKLTGCQNNVAN